MSITDYALDGVRGLTAYETGRPVEEIAREFGVQRISKLASNENPLGCSPQADAALRAGLDWARYPDGGGYALKAALSAHHSGFDTAGITLGNGSNDVLELLARCFLAPGRNAVASAHAFAVYALATQACGATLREVPALGIQPHRALPREDLQRALQPEQAKQSHRCQTPSTTDYKVSNALHSIIEGV